MSVYVAHLVCFERIGSVLVVVGHAFVGAWCVRAQVGSWAEPQEYPGLAHFCEHMLFQGSQKYPGVHDYMDFVQAHGGSSC